MQPGAVPSSCRQSHVVSDEATHHGVICKLDDGVGSMHRPAVMGLEGVYIYII